VEGKGEVRLYSTLVPRFIDVQGARLSEVGCAVYLAASDLTDGEMFFEITGTTTTLLIVKRKRKIGLSQGTALAYFWWITVRHSRLIS
jgi:hypothetical protein